MTSVSESQTAGLTRETITREVQGFYASLPFNYYETASTAAQALRRRNLIAVYQDLDQVLRKMPPAQRVLDIGCGGGWLVNSIALHYKRSALGIDLCEKALQRAREVSSTLRIEQWTELRHLDLFDLDAVEGDFHLVSSLGVLHHTFDCRRALHQVSRKVKEGGYLYLGLYHRYGREPFLQLFEPYRRRMLEASSDSQRVYVEEEAFGLYRQLNQGVEDEGFLRSWFRDQVFHPHESQHTAGELVTWLGELGFVPLSTSLNRFKEVRDWQLLFEDEKKMSDLSRQRNYVEKVYFPGFFTLLSRKTG